MRVAVVIARSDRVGGANVYVRDLCMALQRHGVETNVFVGGDGPFLEDLNRNGIAYTVIPTMARAVDPRADIRSYRKLKSALRQWRPDLIAAHTAKAGALTRVVARSLSVPVVYTPHGWSFYNGEQGVKVAVYRMLERILSLLPATIVHVSHSEQRLALDHRVGRNVTSVVIQNGVPDIPPLLRADVTREPVRIVSVARFEPPKDQPTLLLALAGLRDRDWTLDLIGDGPLLGSTEAMVHRHGLRDRVRFLGFRTDIPRHLAAAQIFVLMTKAESLPLTLLEAMRAGLPVVASAVGGILEVVRPGRDGLLVPDGDVTGLKLALRSLIEDGDLRRRLGASARKRYVEAFEHERMVRQLSDLYELVGSQPSQRVSAGRRLAR